MSVRLALAATVVLLAGCASTPGGAPTGRVRGGSVSPDLPRLGGAPDGGAPTFGGRDPARGDLAGTAARPTSAATRRVCRGTAWPSGWIAVAYEAAAGDECPKGSTSNGNRQVAVLTRYAGQPVGAQLDVCADQHVPADWHDDGREEGDVGACPGAGPNGGSATRHIRKVR